MPKEIIIYLIGMIVCYIILRRIKTGFPNRTWKDVGEAALMSIFWWCVIPILIIGEGITLLSDKTKPPKWL